MIRKSSSLILIGLLLGCSQPNLDAVKSTNPQIKINVKLDVSSLTLSGISSGGYMAHQYHVAYSSEVAGVALLASGPYGCALNDLKTALTSCMNNSQALDIEPLLINTKLAAESKSIDDLEYLVNDKVWVFRGSNDHTISQSVSGAQVEFYRRLNVVVDGHFESKVGHGFPTKNTGVQCERTEAPFINHCETNVAEDFLNYLYSTSKASNMQPDKTESNLNQSQELDEPLTGRLIAFEQASFLPQGQQNTLADTGYVYVPESCRKGKICQLHMALHGCQQNADTLGMQFIEQTGLNQWAEANSLVVLYPQTKASYMPLNPKACWDWWGYTGDDYLLKSGAQLSHLNRMVNNIVMAINAE